MRRSSAGSGFAACRSRLTEHQSFAIAMQPLLDRSRSVLDRVLQGALPDGGHTPAKSPKRLHVSPVTIDISLELLLPELLVGSGCGGIATAFVSMPEAAVDEYYRSVLREHEVRGSGQLSDMKPISESPGEEKGAKSPLRPSVLSANTRHHAAAQRGSRDAHGLGRVPLGYLQKSLIRLDGSDPLEGIRKLSMQLICEKSQGEY